MAVVPSSRMGDYYWGGVWGHHFSCIRVLLGRATWSMSLGDPVRRLGLSRAPVR